MMSRSKLAVAGVAGMAALIAVPATASAGGGSFIGGFTTVTTLGSTVPSNGDVNPYGIVVVPRTAGNLVAGDILISNFNNDMSPPAGLQGTGSTLVELTPSGSLSLFAQIDAEHLPGRCPGGVGLTTALGILPGNFVVVGSLPTTDGTSATMRAGCLIVLDSSGTVVETVSGGHINGPWDLTVVANGNRAELFVSNVLNGTLAASPATVNRGTVVRIDVTRNAGGPPSFGNQTVVGSGFGERTDPNALVVGPTGVGLGRNGMLYVADSVYNRIAAIPDPLSRNSSAGSGLDVTANGSVNDPLGLAIAPNGDVLTTNGNDGLVVETTPQGSQVASFDSGFGGGSLFGLAVAPHGSDVYLVDDGNNTLALLH